MQRGSQQNEVCAKVWAVGMELKVGFEIAQALKFAYEKHGSATAEEMRSATTQLCNAIPECEVQEGGSIEQGLQAYAGIDSVPSTMSEFKGTAICMLMHHA